MKDVKDRIAALQNKFSCIVSAMTFAEAGEVESAREQLEPARSVVLAANEDTLNPKVFNYATNVSKRMDASLKLLFVSNRKRPWDALESCLKKMAGFFKMRSALIKPGTPLQARVTAIDENLLSIEIRQGCIRNQVVDYTNEHSGVLFVILESDRNIASGCSRNGQPLDSAWENLACPVVCVSELDPA